MRAHMFLIRGVVAVVPGLLDLGGPTNAPPPTRPHALAIAYRIHTEMRRGDRVAELAADLRSMPRLARLLWEVAQGIEDLAACATTKRQPT